MPCFQRRQPTDLANSLAVFLANSIRIDLE